jgi:hypothetical protein
VGSHLYCDVLRKAAEPPPSPSAAAPRSPLLGPEAHAELGESASDAREPDPDAWHVAHPAMGIVIPFLLVLPEEAAHRRIVQDWQQNQPADARCKPGADALLTNARRLQAHLEEDAWAAPGAAAVVVPLNAASFTDTLERMHSIVLERMQTVFDQVV